MIITCPACTKRYKVDGPKLGTKGRLVRCVACAHTWRQDPVASDTPQAANALPSAARTNIQRSSKGNWVILSFAIILTLVSFVFARQHLVHAWPNLQSLYSVVGLGVSLPGDGLALQNTMVQPSENKKSVVLKGEIINITKEVKPLSPLNVSIYGSCDKASWLQGILAKFKGNSQCIIDSWSVTLPRTRLLPGERFSFKAPINRKVDSIQEVRVNF